MDVPNIFNLATSELSQDAAIAYNLAWADSKFKSTHPEHHALGADLLGLFAGEYAQNLNIGNVEIQVGLQRNHIDVWVYIGCEAVLIIEDKTNSFEHGDQINRYRGIATKWLDPEKREWGPERVIAAYLKTGNESVNTAPNADYLNKIDRVALLKILNQHKHTKDEVVDQFRNYLENWENATQSFLSSPINEDWSWQAVEGFYVNLENEFVRRGIEIIKWEYVPNQLGGFLAFYWNWVAIPTFNCELYLQIRQGKELEIRVSGARDENGKHVRASSKLRWQLLGRLQEIVKAEKYSGLDIEKSGSYRPGWTGGVAYVRNFLKAKENGKIDMNETIEELHRVHDLLAEVAN